MTFSWRDIFVISITVLVLGITLAMYGIVARSESVIIASSVLILFPIPFVILSRKGLRGEVNPYDLYGNAIIALLTISIISLIGYFLFATASGKAVSLAIFIGTTLSLIIEYLSRKRESKERRESTIGNLDETAKQEEMDSEK